MNSTSAIKIACGCCGRKKKMDDLTEAPAGFPKKLAHNLVCGVCVPRRTAGEELRMLETRTEPGAPRLHKHRGKKADEAAPPVVEEIEREHSTAKIEDQTMEEPAGLGAGSMDDDDDDGAPVPEGMGRVRVAVRRCFRFETEADARRWIAMFGQMGWAVELLAEEEEVTTISRGGPAVLPASKKGGNSIEVKAPSMNYSPEGPDALSGTRGETLLEGRARS